jgi:hypothetical protein
MPVFGYSSKPRPCVMKTPNSDLQKIEEFIQLNGKVLLIIKDMVNIFLIGN